MHTSETSAIKLECRDLANIIAIEKPVNVLYVNGGIMRRGGIESFMMNYYRHIDHARVHIDFLVHGYGQGIFDKEIEASGSKIIHVPVKSRHPLKYSRELRRIFASKEYMIVHSHTDAMSAWILRIAKQCNVPIRIAHSHNTDHLTSSKLKYALNEFARKRICRYATHRFACSEKAGKWLFKDNTFTVIPNAIELHNFQFDSSVRDRMRNTLSLNNENIVIGHVGRFDTQKNHEFLLDVFDSLSKMNIQYRLLLIGEGWLKEAIMNSAEARGLKDKVLFLGERSDVAALYNAMDLFVLPSLFEGLAVVLVEAQANGLPVLASDTITREASINKNIWYIPLNKELWAQEISNLANGETGRVAFNPYGCKYDIEKAAKLLQNKYCEWAKADA